MNILDICRKYPDIFPLKKIGENKYTCCCPFHKEKNPSFFVFTDTNTFYCFGCNKGVSVSQLIEYLKTIGIFEKLEESEELVEIKKIKNKIKNIGKKNYTLDDVLFLFSKICKKFLQYENFHYIMYIFDKAIEYNDYDLCQKIIDEYIKNIDI